MAEHLRIGVCIVRVEAQPDHLLITVTTDRHVDRNLHSVRPEPPQLFSDPEAAVQAVAEFLSFFGES
jgi:hypothetical protein